MKLSSSPVFLRWIKRVNPEESLRLADRNLESLSTAFAVKFSFSILCIALVSCSGGEVKSLGDLEAATVVNISVEKGNGQSGVPRLVYPQQIEFKVTDTNGEVVPDADVSMRLIDVTGVEDLSVSQLVKAWESDTFSIASDVTEEDLAALPVDIVGEIKKSSETSDSSGIVSATVQATSRYSRTIAIVARVIGDEGIGGGAGYATLLTGEFGSTERMVLETSNSLSEIAGVDFELYVAIHNDNGQIQNFNQSATVTISATIPDSHAISIFPDGDVECEFLGGRCKVPGGPFQLNTEGEVTVAVSSPALGVADIESIIRVERGAPAGVILSFAPPTAPVNPVCVAGGDPLNISDPCTKISADQDEVDVYVLVVDQGGNPISGAASSWSATGPLSDRLESAAVSSPSSPQKLLPQTTGTGMLTVVADGFTLQNAYEILPGQPSYYTVKSEHDNEEVATVPFKVSLELYDRKDNFVHTYSGEDTITFTLDGATAAPNATLPISSLNEAVTFAAGVALTEGILQAVNAAQSPTITVAGQLGTYQSDVVQIDPGPTTSLLLRDESGGVGASYDTDFIIAATDTVTMHVAGYDDLLNYTEDVASSFTGQNVLSGKLQISSGTVTVAKPDGATGTGTITATPHDSSIPAIVSPTITVTTDAAVRFQIQTTNSNTEPAGEDFEIFIHALDAENNDSDQYVGAHTINFVSITSPSWAGDAAVLPEGDVVCTFTLGICQVPGGPWKVTNGDSPAILSVSDVTGLPEDIPDIWSAFITASVGATPDRIVIANATGGPPGALPVSTMVDLISGKIEITADTVDALDLFATYVDKGGNYIGPASASTTWVGGGDLAVMAAANFTGGTTGSNTTFDGALVGEGFITASAAGVTDGVTPTIAISHGVLDRIRVLESGATPDNNVDPGSCFQLGIEMQDGDNNKVTSYNMTNTLTLTWETAESGPAVRAQPEIRVNGTSYYLTWSGSVGVLNGDVNLQNMDFCLYDATAVTPTLRVDFPAKDGHPAINSTGHASHSPSDTFTITVGPANHVHYTLDGTDTGNFACPYNGMLDINATCNLYNVDNGDVTLHAALHDAGGNFLGLATGDWAVPGHAGFNSDLVGGSSSSSVTLDNEIATYSYQYLDFTNGGAGPDASARFYIQPGAIDHITATINGGNAVVADVTWPIEIQLRDQYSNITGYNTTHSVTVDFGGTATNSPNGTPPATGGNLPSAYFQFGTHLTGSTFYTPNASETPTLTITVAGYPAINPVISPVAGVAVEGVILDAPSAAGAEIPNMAMLTVDSMDLYACARDSEGNYKTCGVDSAWSATHELDGNFSPISGSTTELTPVEVTDAVGYGVVTMTPHDTNISAASTGQITVNNGPLAFFFLRKNVAPINSATAGQQFTLSLEAHDIHGNPVAEFDGSKWISWSSSNYAQTLENLNVSLPTDGNFNFTDGICNDTINVTLFNASVSPRVDVVHNDGSSNYYGNSVPFGGFNVNPDVPHHYGVTTPTNVDAKSDHSQQFSATIQMRDEWGNQVCCGEAGITVDIMTTGGAATNGTLTGTLNTTLAGMTSRVLNDLAYDIQGARKIKLTSASFSTTTLSSETINFQPNNETIANYEIIPITPATAGVAYPFTVRALDNEGSPVSGTDATINAMTHTWSGPTSAPDSTPPTLPEPNFIGGQATVIVTLFKDELIPAASFTIRDDQAISSGTTDRVGQATVAVDVGQGPLSQYFITASTGGTTADQFGTFDLNITAYDQWENPRPGDGCVNLVAVYVSGVPNTGSFSGPTSCINISSGAANVVGATYNVPHTISFTTTSSAPTTSSDQIAFTPTIHTVDNYLVTIPTSAVAGPGNVTATVSARDGGNNVLDDDTVDTALNAQAYCWSGAGTSPSPASTAPAYDVTPAFSDGVSTFDHSFYLDETIAAGGVVIQDDYMGSCGPTRQGTSAGAIDVDHTAADKYRVTSPTSQAKTAGVGFDATVTAYDPYDNVDLAYGPATLTWSWSGTTNTSIGGVPADVEASASKAFTNGVYTSTGGPFVLYNESDATPVLNLISGFGANLGGWSVGHNATVDFIKIHNTGAPDTAHTSEVTTHAMTTDQTEQLWAHGYDQWGNYIALQSVTWAGTGNLAGDVPAGPADNTTVAPSTVGTGTVTADASGATTDDATDTWTINPGAPVAYQVEWVATTSPVTAGATFDIRITALDADSNTATSYAGSKALSFAWTNASTAPDTTTQPAKLANSNYTFAAGVYQSSGGQFALFNDSDTNAYITVSGDLTAGNSPQLGVDPAAASQYRIVAHETTSQTAGVGFDITVQALDPYDNIDTNFADTAVHFNWTNTTASPLQGETGDVPANAVRDFVNGVWVATANEFILYNEADTNATINITNSFTGSLGGFGVTHNATVSHVHIHDTGASDQAHTDELDTESKSADETLQVWAHGYDQWGNWIALQNVTWAGTGALAGDVAPTTSSNTTTLTANLVGTGTITADHASATDDATGTITITPGAAAKWSVDWTSATSPVTAGSDFGITITALDSDDNVATGFTGSQAVAFAWNSATNAPDTTAPKKLADANYTFASGVYNSPATAFALYNDNDTAAYVTVTGSSLTADNTSTLAVDPAAADHYNIVAHETTSQTAGVGFDITVQALDPYDNIDTNFADTAVHFNWTNTTASPLQGETGDVPANAVRDFVNGVWVATANDFILYNEADTNATINITNSFTGSLGGFGVTHNATVSHVYIHDTSADDQAHTDELDTASKTADETMQVWAHGYDAWGNWIALQSVTWSGTGALAGDVSPTSGNTTTLTANLVGNGTFSADHATATDDTSGTITITPGAATQWSVDWTSATSPVTAGGDFGITVTALDSDSNVATGFTGSQAVAFAWNSATNAPDTTAPKKLADANYTFAAGVYNSPATAFALYNDDDTAAYVTVTGSSLTADNTSTLAVDPAAADHYNIVAHETTSQTAGVGFDITVQALDPYDNIDTNFADTAVHFNWTNTTASPLQGETGDVPADAVRDFVNGVWVATANDFILYNEADTNATINITNSFTGSLAGFSVTHNATVSHVYIHDTNAADQAHTDELDTASKTADETMQVWAHGYDAWGNWIALQNVTWSGTGALAGDVSPTAASNTTTLTANLVGTGTFSADHATATDDTSGTITITPGTATQWSVDWTSATSPVTAGNDFGITITALDSDSNVATGFTGSQAVAFAWNSATNAPDTTAPKKLADANYTFAAGVYTSPATAFALYNDDDTAAYVTVTGSSLTADNTSTLAVDPAAADHYNIIAHETTSQTAGVGFDITVQALDPYDNIDTNFADTAVHFNWTNTTASPLQGETGDVPADAVRDFVNGVWVATANDFILYNEADTNATINITNSFTGSLAGFSVTHNATVSHVYIHDTNAADQAHTDELDTASKTADETMQVWAHGYDAWGNWIALQSVTWSGTGALAGDVAPTTASNTTTLTANLVGTGTFSADHATATDDTSGTITITPGAATQWSVDWTSATSPVTAGSDFGITITALDSDSNVATGFTGSQAVAFAWNSATNAPDTTAPKKLADANYTFAAGVYNSPATAFALYNDDDTAAYVTVTGSSLTADNTSTLAVDPAAADHYNIIAHETTSQTAGVGFDITVQALDPYDNIDTNFADTAVHFNWTNTTASPLQGETGDVPANAVRDFVDGEWIPTANEFILYNEADTNATINITNSFGGTLGGFGVTHNATVSHVYIHDTSAADQAHTDELDTASKTADETMQVWAHGYDAWGNWIALQNVTWSGTGALAGDVSPTSGNTTTLTANLVGTGTFSADHATATDDTSGTITITPGAATQWSVDWTSATSPVTAGGDFGITVTALDSDSNVATGFTGSQAVAFAWNSATNAPDTTAPKKLADANYTFAAGVYTSPATAFALYNDDDTAAYITVTGSSLTADNTSTLAVDPAAADHYNIIAHETTSQTAGVGFDITVQALDPYDNIDTNFADTAVHFNWTNTTASPLQGETGDAPADAVRDFVDGEWIPTANEFILYNEADTNATINITNSFTGSLGGFGVTHNATVSHVYVHDTNAVDQAHTDELDTASKTADETMQVWAHGYDAWGNWIALQSVTWSGTGALAGDVSPTSGNTTTLTANLVGTGTFSADHATATDDTSGTITITPGTATQWSVDWTSATSPVTAGGDFGITVTALDSDSNVATGFTGSQAVAFAWNNATNAPDTTAPKKLADANYTFASGVYNSAATAFALYNDDDTNAYITVTGSGLTANNTSSLAVDPAAADHYNIIAHETTSQTAGVGFDITVQALDPYDNIDTNFADTAVHFNWTNTTASPLQGETGDVPANAVRDFVDGEWIPTANEFILYNEADTNATINITNSFGGSLGGFGVTHNATVSHVYIHDTGASDQAHTDELDTASKTADETMQVWAHGYDAWGNWIALQSVTWSGTGALAGDVSPTSGNTTTLTANLVGTGTFSADHATATDDTSGTITITPGTATQWSVDWTSATSPVSAGDDFGITVTALDSDSNVATGFTGSQAVAFAWNNATNAPDTTAPKKLADANYTFASGVYNSAATAFALYNDDDTNAYITVTGSGLTANNTSSLAVDPAAADHYNIIAHETTSQTAGVGFDITVQALDPYDNIDTNFADTAVHFNWTNTTASPLQGETGDVPADAVRDFVAGEWIPTANEFVLYNEADTNATINITNSFTGSLGGFSVTHNATVSHVYIHDTSAVDQAHTDELDTASKTADETMQVWAHGYDAWGNWIALQSVTWSGTGALAGDVSPTAASNTTTLTANLVGTGTFSADHATATDDTSGTITITPGTATQWSVDWTSATSPVTAGGDFGITVTALDSDSNVATGFTGSQAVAFAWNNATNAPDTTAPKKLADANYTFASGVYNSAATAFALYNDDDTAAYITVTGSGLTANNTSSLAVDPAAADHYNIVAHETTSQTAGVGFDITVQALDPYDNIDTNFADTAVHFNWTNTTASPLQGETGDVPADAVRDFVAGEWIPTANEFVLYNEADTNATINITNSFGGTLGGFGVTHNATVSHVYVHDTSAADQAHTDELDTASKTADETMQVWAHGYDAWGNWIALQSVTWSGTGALAGDVSPTAASNTTTLTANLVGTGTFSADHATATDDTSGTITITPGTATQWSVDWTSATSPVTAGDDFGITVTALDSDSNVATGFTGSQAVNFAWNNATNAPDTTAPKKLADANYTFASGVYNSAATAFALYNDDDTNAYITVTGSGLTANNTSSLAVDPAAADHYNIVAHETTSQTAGVGFDITVQALDPYDNIDTNFADTAVHFNWTNTTASPLQGETGDVPANAVRDFVDGEWIPTANEFVLYNEADTNATINITNSFGGTLGGFGVTHNATVSHVYIHDTSAADQAHTDELDTASKTADETMQVWAHGYDAWGNWIALQSVTWSGTGALAGDVSPTSGNTTTLTANLVGTGTFSADHATATDDTSGTITITPGTATQWSVDWTSATSPVTAGDDFGITVTALDSDSNVATGFTGSQAVAFAWNNATNAPDTTAPKKLADANYTFASGVYNSAATAFALYNDDDTNAYITVTGSGLTANNTSSLAVDPAAADHYNIIAHETTSQTAGVGFDITVQALDPYDNIDTNFADTAVHFNWTNTTASPLQGETGDVPANAGRDFVAGEWIPTANEFVLYNEADTNATINITNSFTGSLAGFSVTHNATVSHVYVHDTNAVDQAHTDELDTASKTADETMQVWAHGYDAWGNWIALQSVTWSGTGALAGDVSPTSGNTTTLTANLVGTGTFSADHATATDDTSGTITITPGTATQWSVDWTSATSPVTAGGDFGITVTALDSDSNVATGFTGSQAVAFAWNNATNAPDTTAPKKLADANYTFASGVYNSAATAFALYNDDDTNAYITVTGSGLTANNTSSLAVDPAAADHYNIIAHETTSQTAGVGFDITVQALDPYDNIDTNFADTAVHFNWTNTTASPLQGETGDVPANAVRDFVAGEWIPTANEFVLYNEADTNATINITNSFTGSLGGFGVTHNATVSHVYVHDTNAVDQAHTDELDTASKTADETMQVWAHGYDAWGNWIALQSVTWSGTGALAGDVSPTAASNTTTLTANLVGTGTFSADHATATDDTSGTITITPGAATQWSVDWTSATSPVTAGGDFGITVTALDSDSNVATGFTGSQAVAFAWNNATNAPDTTAPKKLADANYTFASGVYNSAATAFALYNDDDTTAYITVTGSSLTADNTSTLAVDPAAADHYNIIAHETTSQTAGVGFDITVQALDPYDNIDTNFADTAVHFNWTNTTASPLQGETGDVPADAVRDFVDGEWIPTANEFILYNEVDTNATINITNSFTGSLGGFSVTHNATVSHVYVHDVSTADTAHTAELDTHTMTTDQTKQVWAHGYDAWGNWIALQNVTWTASGALNGDLSPTSGSNTTTLSASLVGTGAITADHATATDDSTGTFTVNPGNPDHYDVEWTSATSPVTAGDEFGITITALDADGNTATGYTGSKALTFAWTGATNAPDTTAPKKLADTNYTFAAGVYTSAATDFALYNDDDTAAYITVTGDITQDTTSSLAVDPDDADHYDLTVGTTSAVAGNGFNVTVKALDPYDNIDTNFADTSLTFSWAGTTPSVVGAVTADVEATSTKDFVNGVWASSGNPFVLYNEYDSTPVLNLTNSFGGSITGWTVTHNTTVDFVKVHDVSTADTAPSAEMTTHAMEADETKQVWSHGYDEWGNWIGLESVSWTASNNIAGDVSPTSGNTTTLSPTDSGTGAVTADHASATDDSTGTFTVSPADFDITAPSSDQSTDQPTITWESSEGTVDYSVKVSTATDCSSPAASYTISHPTVTKVIEAGDALADNTYYVCVTANGNASTSTDATNGGASTSFEVETSTVHVSYTTANGGTDYLKYGKKVTTSAWATETVDSTTDDIHIRSSLALDDSDKPHISYRKNDGTYDELNYARNTTGSWQKETIFDLADSSDDAGLWSTVALDSAGNVRILSQFKDDSADDMILRHDYGAYTSWSNENIENLDLLSQAYNIVDSSVAVDSSDDAHAIYAYYDGTNYVLKYRNETTNWSSPLESITATGCSDYVYASVVTDGSAAHVAFICVDSGACKVYYTERTGGSWATAELVGTPVASGCSAGTINDFYRPSITLDSSDCAHIAYKDAAASNLKYATNTNGSCNASWSPAAASTGSGDDATIALDDDDIPYIFFLDSGNVKVATKNSGSWATSDVDASGNATGVGTTAISGVNGRSNP